MAKPKNYDSVMAKANAAVEAKFGGAVICNRCQATLVTFADACTADLGDMCPGFLAIDDAKQAAIRNALGGALTQH